MFSGFDVAVEDARGMCVRKGFEQVRGDADRVGGRHGALTEPVTQRLTLNQLHRKIGPAVVFAVFEKRRDGRVLQASGRLDLLEEPFRELAIEVAADDA